jgi:glycerol-3-phosphate dehydrogenase
MQHRLAHAYGTRTRAMLGNCRTMSDLGAHFGADLYAREVRWLIDEEWACTADDVLWRRSKLGLRLTGAERDALAEWMTSGVVSASRAPSRS